MEKYYTTHNYSNLIKKTYKRHNLKETFFLYVSLYVKKCSGHPNFPP